MMIRVDVSVDNDRDRNRSERLARALELLERPEDVDQTFEELLAEVMRKGDEDAR